MTMTPEQIAAAWALVNAATEGPWFAESGHEQGNGQLYWQVTDATDAIMQNQFCWCQGDHAANAAFIAASRELVPQLLTALEAEQAKVARLVDTFYIDCEFDGHNGPLLSIAMVRGDGYSTHVEVIEDAKDPWVIANVMPIMGAHKADVMRAAAPNYVGSVLRNFIEDCAAPTIIADSPVDIGRFCRAISTGKDGQWQAADFSQMKFVVHNVDCYPTTLEGAVQHNAWWDAMALRALLTEIKETDHE